MDPAQVSEIIAIYQSTQSTTFCVAALIALAVYSWFINLNDELSLFWPCPTKGVSLLYFAIRYLPFFEPVLSMITAYPMSDERCDLILRVGQVLTLAVYIAPTIFSANRAYALSEQTRFIYCVVLILSLAPFFVNLISSIVWVKSANLPPPLFCSQENLTPAPISLIMLLSSRLSLIIADLVVILVTWRATYKVIKETGGLLKTSITQVLLFNGAIYFIVLLLLNICQIILTDLSITTFGDVSYVPAFLDLLMSILNADFLLNLQKAASSSSSSYADSAQLGSGGLPSLNFAAISQSNHAGFAADADDVSLPEASPGA